jgi:hypothetical protein
MADEDAIKVLNATTTWYDVPKDLDISFPSGGKLSNTDARHSSRITQCMKHLFEVTVNRQTVNNTLPNWVSVGAKSNKILEALTVIYGTNLATLNHVGIVREKHSSGHSSRPSELNVMQDCGPVDVVANPILTITPGSVIDPAGKTKVTAVNLIDNAAEGASVLTLDMKYIQLLALNKCITAPITVSIDDKDYKVTIPTILTTINGGIIIAYFSKSSFLPNLGRGHSKYFQGNPIKNETIDQLIASGNTTAINDEICAYILMKELGDTLQVIWINKLFDENATYTKNNTTIITSDAVVKYRSIINSVPVIFSEKNKTTYICPADTDMINKAFINTIARELYAHNASIIKVIDNVIKAKPSVGNTWLGNTWRNSQHINTAILILEHYRQKLIIMHDETKLTMPRFTSVDDAKGYISEKRFNCPFIIKLDGIKIVQTFTSFLSRDPSFKFTVKNFTESVVGNTSNHKSNFPSYATSRAGAPQAGGGEIIQKGGFNIMDLRNIIAGILIQTVTVAAKELVEKTEPSSINPAVAAGVMGAAAVGALIYRHTRPASPPPVYYSDISVDDKAIDETNDVALKILENMKGKCNADKSQKCLAQGELYCYVKEYFPEIFTYAIQLVKATPAASRTPEDIYIVNPEFLTRYESPDMKAFTWNEDNMFVSYISVTEAAELHNKQAARAIFLAEALIKYYPGLQRKRLNLAINKLKSIISIGHGLYKSIIYASDPDTLNLVSMRGGTRHNHEKKDIIPYSDEQKMDLDIAMELYELHYSRLIKSAYTDINTDEMIEERLNTIVSYDTTIPEEYSKDKNYKDMNTRIFELIMEEYSSLPLVREYASYISDDFDRVIAEFMKAKKKTETLTIVEVLHKMLENNPELQANAPLPRHMGVLATGSANHDGGSRFRNLKYTRKTRRKQRKTRTTRVRRSKRDTKK